MRPVDGFRVLGLDCFLYVSDTCLGLCARVCCVCVCVVCVCLCVCYDVFVFWCECVGVSEYQCAQKSRKARARNLR